MHFDELKNELARILPEHHPFLEKFNAFDPKEDDTLDDLIEAIQDWERGIRDWKEVQERIDKA